MEEINPKKLKKSPRDRHLFWINYYGSINFGIWVECTKCKKWRRTFQYSESHEVPESWCCSMHTLDSGEKGSCNDPEEESAEPYLDYYPGSIVWAKLDGYPWWPSMVDADPDTDEYSCRKDETVYYNVTFLDKKPTHAWIPEMFICPFSEAPKVKKGYLEKLRQNRYAKAISRAKKRAEAAMEMTIKDRLLTYSFGHLYKGHWPTTQIEECGMKENGSRNIEEKVDIIKKPDELRPCDITNTDDNGIEKDFSRKENNTAEEGKMISKNPDIPSLKKKTCNKKFLNKKDYILKKSGVFPFMEKKDSKFSSVSKTLRNNLVECTENIADIDQEKKAKGIKRKTDRKFVLQNEKKFDNQSLTGGTINLESTNSEYEGNENFNAVSVPKEDDSRSIRAPEERSIAENNENGFSEIPNYEKHSPEKQINNVNPLDKKELKKNTNLVECAENITGPVQEKEAIGMKRKINRKFTPRKEKKFENPSQHSTDGIIDLECTKSEYKGNEDLNTVTVPKDESRFICALTEISVVEGNENGFNKVSNNEKIGPEKQTNNVKPLNEKKKKLNISVDKTMHSSHLPSKKEILKHIDEAISAVLEFDENQNLEKIDECNSSNQKKKKTSNEPQQKSIKQKKSQKSLDKIIQSNSKVTNLEESITQISQVPPETKALPNVGNSTSEINKQIITEAPELMKHLQKNMKQMDSKMNGFPKQSTSSFSVPVKSSAGQKDEVVVSKITNLNTEYKASPQKPEKIIILL